MKLWISSSMNASKVSGQASTAMGLPMGSVNAARYSPFLSPK
ncbi:MAG: hypothetical protein U1E74_09560 [Paenacidovorax caeni]